jgi:hypothetical protein
MEDVLYLWTFCTVERTFCREGRYVEGRYVWMDVPWKDVLY